MEDINSAVETLLQSADTLFVLGGAIMVLAMHAGFAFLEVGTVREKNQVNALVKIITDFGVSTLGYFFVGYWLAYGEHFFASADTLAADNGYQLVKFFFLLTFAAAIPAIVSGGVAERARFYPMLLASLLCVSLLYPTFEGMIWNGNYGFQTWLEQSFGAQFHDFAGSVVVHGVGGWIALAAIMLLGTRQGRVKGGTVVGFAPSNIPMLALGAWVLTVGWFGFNVMSAQQLTGISGLVALNSLMAMVGGIVVAMLMGKNDPGFIHNGPLAGLVAVCAGSDLMHPIGALIVGSVAGGLFIVVFTYLQNRRPDIDDVLGVWPLHGLCGVWGGIAAGIFGLEALGGLGGVTFMSQLIGSITGLVIALVGGFVIYGLVKTIIGIRLSQEDEFQGADLAIHKIKAINSEVP
ncbi:ammonium transporter [Corallincola holothuriorum]|uniref:Ammonium transporter n=1 Tax=Corallincola holothuriorum TaxID=2282215 RepID=A0A368N6E4_9GAMM|nr:ammonium transporter [Corallincola holothuriorum]RCU45085.1 ammonium transporter [Corallincola holothuriorum]